VLVLVLVLVLVPLFLSSLTCNVYGLWFFVVSSSGIPVLFSFFAFTRFQSTFFVSAHWVGAPFCWCATFHCRDVDRVMARW